MRKEKDATEARRRSAVSPPWWDALLARARRYGRRFAVDPEDLVQGTAAVYLAREAPPVDAAPWLERVLRNRAIDTWRRHQREKPSIAALPEEAMESSPLAELEAQEERQLLARACAALRPNERALLARRFDQAGAVGLSPSERTRLRRVLLRLRRELAHLRAVVLWPGALGAQGTAALVVVTPVLMAASLGLGPQLRSPSAPPGGEARGRRVEVHHVARQERERAPVEEGLAASRPTITAAVAAATGPSAAQTHAVVRPLAHPTPAREPAPTAAETRFDFDEDEVEGTLQAPDEIFVDGRQPTKNPSLIELRRDFVPELVKGLEDMD